MHIKLSSLSKSYPFTRKAHFKLILKMLMGLGKDQQYVNSGNTKAISNVSLSASEGECIGIIGANGAGKTTLLQIIAGIAQPDDGEIDISGDVNCVLGLGIGIRDDLTGMENILIEADFKKAESPDKQPQFIKEVVAFADLGDAINRPVRTYSSGMRARLAFSMMAHIQPEILLIDETLSVGDNQFCRKAAAKMKEICARGKIVIVVSHSMPSIAEMCNRCIWMDKGQIVMDGPPKVVTNAYLAAVHQADEMEVEKRFQKRIGCKCHFPNSPTLSVEFIDTQHNPKRIFNVGEDMTIRILVDAKQKIQCPDFQISFERTDGIMVIQNLASQFGFEKLPIEGRVGFELPFNKLLLGKHTYEVRVELFDMSTGNEPVLLSCGQNVLQIENHEYPYENPILWTEAQWNMVPLQEGT